MKYHERDENKYIKEKLKFSLFVTPPLILIMWLHENNYFGVFG